MNRFIHDRHDRYKNDPMYLTAFILEILYTLSIESASNSNFPLGSVELYVGNLNKAVASKVKKKRRRRYVKGY